MTTTGGDYHPEDSESYMNPRQQEYFRSRLLQWRDRLQQERRQSMQRIRTNERTGGDLIDLSVKDHGRTMDFIAHGRLEQTICQIDAALQRIAEGHYGYCTLSGEEIGLRRLLAYPTATLSVEAQEQLENRQRIRQPAFSS